MSAVRTRTPSGEAIVILAEAEYDRLVALAGDGTAALAVPSAPSRGAETPATLAVWRGRRRMSDEDLARKAGISRGYLAEIESGQRSADARTTERLAQALGLTAGDIAPS